MSNQELQKTVKQTQALFDNYGVLNGDNDILHYDDAYAKARGFRGTLGHGLMYTAYVCDLAAKKFGRDWHYKGRLTVKYVRGVCPGDELVTTITEDNQVHCKSQFDTTLVGAVDLA